MPFYEYECQACKFYLEVMQKISDKALSKCPSCGKKALKKLVSAPVFRLKGAGWYETDFKTDKEGKRNLAGTEKDEAKPEAKAEGKTEAKPEAKESKPESKDTKESKPVEAKSERAGRTRRGAPARAAVRAPTRAKPKKAKTRRKARR
jgi:putative FmdB family regulatory protein